MTAELNSHQRVSYYTGVKLIRHHQNQGNNNNNSSTTTAPAANNSTANPSNSGAGGSSVTTPGGYFPPHNHHHSHYPLHGQPPHHQRPPPPLPPHHPGHYHLPCPTGPPHIQHPGGMLHLSNHPGPPHHPHHHNNHGNNQHFGPGGGSNQATRLYAGSPLIRSSAFHSINANTGNQKRSFKHHNRGHHVHNGHYHNGHHNGPKFGGIVNQAQHHHHQNNIIIGGSCSSGTSSSSSSNEHLNNFHSPTGSPTAPPKLDISPLKLSTTSQSHGDSASSTASSSNNSSPGPEQSPLASSASPSSSDGNKDLDHFYFLDEHWKPTNDGANIHNNNNTSASPSAGADMLDNMSSSTSSIMSLQWASSSSGSPSPPASTSATALTMMVDQFFATRDNTQAFSNLVDANNNIVGAPPADFAEVGRNPHPRGDHQDLFHSFSTSGFNNNSGNSCTGASGLFNFRGESNTSGGGIINSRSSLSGGATTVVNVETQIGTFNGQRDLEIRLCFIKGDHAHNGQKETASDTSSFRDTKSSQENSLLTKPSSMLERTASVIGEPFSNSMKGVDGNEHVSMMTGPKHGFAPVNTKPLQGKNLSSPVTDVNEDVSQQS